ncbi:hypothetical protein AAE478_008627 [Parahypoxylon ruwenzoriense]
MTRFLFGRPLGLTRFSLHAHALRQRCMSTETDPQTSTTRRPLIQASDEVSQSEFKRYILGEDIQPGEHVYSVCRKHNIAFPTNLRGTKGWKLGTNPCKLNILVSERHCFSATSMKYLDKFIHPFASSILHMYIAKTSQPLWYSTYSQPVALPFPCRRAARKVKHAFRDALAAHGYDREGRKLASDEGRIRELYGTVRIACGDPKATCNIKFAELLEQMNSIVDVIERVLGRDKFGSPIMTTQRSQNPRRGTQPTPAPKPKPKQKQKQTQTQKQTPFSFRRYQPKPDNGTP